MKLRHVLPALGLVTLALAPFAAAQAPKKAARPPLEAGSGDTEINANGEASFDATANTATFLGGVTVSDQRFVMKSEKLTVFLSKKAAGAASTPVVTGGAGMGGSIERAVAEGGVTLEQHPRPGTADEAMRVTGRGEKAVFDPKVNTVTLTGSPVVRRGPNEHIALSPSTAMVIGRDGSLRTTGPSRTILRDAGKGAELGAPAKKS